MNREYLAKALNQAVCGNKFEDKNLDDYIYASLSQPPIKIIDKNGSRDVLDYTVECPNCGNYVNYGSEIMMLSGHIYCSKTIGCREKLFKELNYESKEY